MTFQLHKIKKAIEPEAIKRKLRMVAEVPKKIAEKARAVVANKSVRRALRLTLAPAAIAAIMAFTIAPAVLNGGDSLAYYETKSHVVDGLEVASDMIRHRDQRREIARTLELEARMRLSTTTMPICERERSAFETKLVVNMFLNSHTDIAAGQSRDLGDKSLAEKVRLHSNRHEKNPSEFWSASMDDREYSMIRMVNKALEKAGGQTIGTKRMNQLSCPTRCLAKLLRNAERLDGGQRGIFWDTLKGYQATMEKALLTKQVISDMKGLAI